MQGDQFAGRRDPAFARMAEEAKARLERIYNALEALERATAGVEAPKSAGKSLALDTFETAMKSLSFSADK